MQPLARRVHNFVSSGFRNAFLKKMSLKLELQLKETRRNATLTYQRKSTFSKLKLFAKKNRGRTYPDKAMTFILKRGNIVFFQGHGGNI
jgi:hypothetical protein